MCSVAGCHERGVQTLAVLRGVGPAMKETPSDSDRSIFASVAFSSFLLIIFTFLFLTFCIFIYVFSLFLFVYVLCITDGFVNVITAPVQV